MSCTGRRESLTAHDTFPRPLLSPLNPAKYQQTSRRSSERWEAGRLQGRSAALPAPLQHLRPNLRLRTHSEPLSKSTQPTPSKPTASSTSPTLVLPSPLNSYTAPTSTSYRPSPRSAHPPSSYNPASLRSYNDHPQRSYERSRSNSSSQPGVLGAGEEEAVIFSRRHSAGISQENLQHVLDMNIAVVDATDVGRTSSLNQVFDLPNDATTSRKPNFYALRDIHYAVRFTKCSIQDLKYTEKGRICWPTLRDSCGNSHIHAVILVYEVSKADGLLALPRMLDALKQSSLPVILVPSRCVQFASIRTNERDAVEDRAKVLCDGIDVFHVAESQSELQKRCVSILLVRCSRDPRVPTLHKPRGPPAQAGLEEGQEMPLTGRRSRADSKLSVRTKVHSRKVGTDVTGSSSDRSSGSSFGSTRIQPPVPPTVSQDRTAPSSVATSPTHYGTTLNALVGRLLKTPFTAAESKFTLTFLATYRMFAAPSELLQAIICQCDYGLNRKSIRASAVPSGYSLDRCLVVIEQWMQSYPGDFALPVTGSLLRTFIAKVDSHRREATIGQRIIIKLDEGRPDCDTYWALADGKLEAASKPATNSTSRTSINPASLATLTTTLKHKSQRVFTSTSHQQFLSTDIEHLATTLASLSHSLLSTLPLRDFLRHASSSQSSSPHLTALTTHFNDLAHLITNLILHSTSPGPRAATLTHTMRLARRLRQLNDYNSLAAVMAGMQATPVHRLQRTWALVEPAQLKDYKSLHALVSSVNDYPSYRLAWENTTGGRVPFVAVHQRDVVVECAKTRTFIEEPAVSGGEAQAVSGASVPASAETSFASTISSSPNSAPSTANTSFTSHASTSTSASNSPTHQSTPNTRLINWAKFESLGSTLHTLSSAQATPYNPSLQPTDAVRALLLETAVETDEEELYQLSCALEPPGLPAGQVRAGVGTSGHGRSSGGSGGGVRGWVRGLGRMSEW